MEYEELQKYTIHYVSCPDICNAEACTRINNLVLENYAKKFGLEDNIKFFDVEDVRRKKKLEEIVKADIIIFDPCNRDYFSEIDTISDRKSPESIFYVLTTFCEFDLQKRVRDSGYEFVCLPTKYKEFFSELNTLVEKKSYLKSLKN